MENWDVSPKGKVEIEGSNFISIRQDKQEMGDVHVSWEECEIRAIDRVTTWEDCGIRAINRVDDRRLAEVGVDTIRGVK